MKRSVLLLVLAGAAATGAWYRSQGPGAGTPPQDVALTGWVEGEERILRSEVAGIVTDVLVREGAVVKRGEPLVRLDTREAISRCLQQEQLLKQLAFEVERARRALDLTKT